MADNGIAEDDVAIEEYVFDVLHKVVSTVGMTETGQFISQGISRSVSAGAIQENIFSDSVSREVETDVEFSGQDKAPYACFNTKAIEKSQSSHIKSSQDGESCDVSTKCPAEGVIAENNEKLTPQTGGNQADRSHQIDVHLPYDTRDTHGFHEALEPTVSKDESVETSGYDQTNAVNEESEGDGYNVWTLSREDLIDVVCILQSQLEKYAALATDKAPVKVCDKELQQKLEASLKARRSAETKLENVSVDRENILDELQQREEMAIMHINRLNYEISGLRRQLTQLLNDRSNGRKLGKRFSVSLLRAKQDADQHLTTVMQVNRKIDEMHIYLTTQTRYILTLEEKLRRAQVQLNDALACNVSQGAGDISHSKEPIVGMPCRVPGEQFRYHGFSEVSNNDKMVYTPGGSTHHQIQMANIFGFEGKSGESRSNDEQEVFNPTNVVFVKGMMHEEGQEMGELFTMLNKFNTASPSAAPKVGAV